MDGGDTASLPVTPDEAERRLAAAEAETAGSGGGQGIPLEQDDDGGEVPGIAELRELARPGTAQLAAEPGRPEADLRQPPADPGGQGEETAAPEGREAGAGLRAHAGDGRTPPRPRSRPGGHPKTDPDSGRRLQPRASDAQPRHPARPPGPRRGARSPRSAPRLRPRAPPRSRPSQPDSRLCNPQDPQQPSPQPGL